MGIVVAVAGGIVMVILIPMIAYFLIFQCGRIKEWLRPPYEIPDDFFLEPFAENYNPVANSTSSGEHYDVISCITPE